MAYSCVGTRGPDPSLITCFFGDSSRSVPASRMLRRALGNSDQVRGPACPNQLEPQPCSVGGIQRASAHIQIARRLPRMKSLQGATQKGLVSHEPYSVPSGVQLPGSRGDEPKEDCTLGPRHWDSRSHAEAVRGGCVELRHSPKKCTRDEGPFKAEPPPTRPRFLRGNRMLKTTNENFARLLRA
jgi:hypothetical protein